MFLMTMLLAGMVGTSISALLFNNGKPVLPAAAAESLCAARGGGVFYHGKPVFPAIAAAALCAAGAAAFFFGQPGRSGCSVRNVCAAFIVANRAKICYNKSRYLRTKPAAPSLRLKWRGCQRFLKGRNQTMAYRLVENKGDSVAVPQLVIAKLPGAGGRLAARGTVCRGDRRNRPRAHCRRRCA